MKWWIVCQCPVVPIRKPRNEHIGYGEGHGERVVEPIAVSVLTPPKRDTRVKAWPRSWSCWFASYQQRVETIFAVLSQVVAVKQLRVHSRWGQWTPFALATAAIFCDTQLFDFRQRQSIKMLFAKGQTIPFD